MKTCEHCAWRSDNLCRLYNVTVNKDNDYCSKRVEDLVVCEKCKRQIVNYTIDITDTIPHILCLDCAALSSTCGGCSNAAHCLFEEDPSPEPKVIMQTQQQGMMIVQTQVMNPSRIAKTCAKGCKCFQNNVCQRENNYCDNHRFSY